jgi:pimeloyl-ACP methyl ester carboxylesterase
MKKLIAAGIATLAFLIGGCSTGDTIGATNPFSSNGNPGGTTPVMPSGSNVALFKLSSGVLPYPTDLYFAGSTDGTLNIQPANALEPNQTAVNALDGYSTNAVIRTTFGGAINPATLTPLSVIVVPVITSNTTKATIGVAGTGAPLTQGVDYTVGVASDAGVGPQILEIRPLHPLTASTCIQGGMFLGANCTTGNGYLVILNNGITDTSGHAAVPDTDYAAIKTALAGGATCPSITDPTLNGVCQLTGAHLQIAQALAAHIPALANSLNPANIVLTFSFTTGSTLDSLELISATTAPQTMKLNATGLPTSAANPLLPGHSDIFVGALTVPYYLSKAAPLTGSWQAPPFPLDMTSTFVTRYNPLPVATQMLQIPVLATAPNANSTAVKAGAVPPWPVLIFQHGITRNREDMLAVADSFADAGFAVVAIDLPLHGITTPYNAANPATFFYASSANPLYAGLGLPASGSIERTFDLDLITPGTIDPSGSHFINLTSLLTARDNLREGAADLITFERSVSNAVVANAGNAKMFAAGQTHYLGHSLGAIVGAVFLGVVPASDVSTGTLANPGGDLSQLLITSPSFAPVINAGLAAQGLTPGTTLYSQFFRDSQNVIDSGDPINYIAQTTGLHPIHLLQVVGSTPPPAGCNAQSFINGCPDQVVPNTATQAMLTASTYGLAPLAQAHATASPLPTVISSGSGVRAYVNFIQGDHGSVIDDVVPAVTGEMQAEAISFTGAPIPPLGIAANTPGSTLVLGLVSSSSIQ